MRHTWNEVFCCKSIMQLNSQSQLVPMYTDSLLLVSEEQRTMQIVNNKAQIPHLEDLTASSYRKSSSLLYPLKSPLHTKTYTEWVTVTC